MMEKNVTKKLTKKQIDLFIEKLILNEIHPMSHDFDNQVLAFLNQFPQRFSRKKLRENIRKSRRGIGSY